MSDLGDWEESLRLAAESVELSQRLADQDPQTFDPSVAAIRGNLAAALSIHGRPREALEHQRKVVQTLRSLVRYRPDAFRESLAGSLRNLGLLLAECGFPEAGLEALLEAQELYELMQDGRRDMPRLDLGMTLSGVARILSSLGRFSEALAPGERAVLILREQVARCEDEPHEPRKPVQRTDSA